MSGMDRHTFGRSGAQTPRQQKGQREDYEEDSNLKKIIILTYGISRIDVLRERKIYLTLRITLLYMYIFLQRAVFFIFGSCI